MIDLALTNDTFDWTLLTIGRGTPANVLHLLQIKNSVAQLKENSAVLFKKDPSKNGVIIRPLIFHCIGGADGRILRSNFLSGEIFRSAYIATA